MTWQTFWNWFDNSASIMWARFQVLLGAIVSVLLVTDLTPWLPAKYLVIWIPINGIITEYLRRTNTTRGVIVVDDQQGVKTDIAYLKSPNPIPEGSKLVKVKE